jgi:large subunit ribosomal protein L28
MAVACQVCGKKPSMGNTVTHRGKAKYLGGVGTKVTGISRRQFRPNLQNVHVSTANGTRKTLRVCTQCIRSGAVTKTIHQKPFKLPKAAETK